MNEKITKLITLISNTRLNINKRKDSFLDLIIELDELFPNNKQNLLKEIVDIPIEQKLNIKNKKINLIQAIKNPQLICSLYEHENKVTKIQTQKNNEKI